MRRIVWDLLMLAMFLAAMSFHFVPKMLHEVLGIALPLAAMLHLAWNRRWIAALPRGQWGRARVLSTAINLLLAASLLAILVTGVCISNHIFKGMVPLDLARNIAIHQFHVSLPFLFLILVGLHLGLHWGSWQERLKRAVPAAAGRALPCRLLARAGVLATIGIGIYGSFQNRVGDRLLMKHIFAAPATGSPGAVYVLLLLGILGLYAALAYGWRAWEERRKP